VLRVVSPPLLVIAGATATGKTGLSLRLVDWLRDRGIAAEILSADSRQVFRGLDIGTAKVSAADRARIPHHGLDLADPDEPFSVAGYVTDAREALAAIAGRGGVAILVGGTGLYLRAIARGLDTDQLPSDAAVRTRIEAELERDGLASLASRLQALAPGRAADIDLRNPRRVVRALEIAELRGDAPLPEPRGYDGPVAWVGLHVEVDVHRDWIATRARDQFASGLLDEARALRERFDPALPAFTAIGYREAWDVLDGRSPLDAAVELDTARNVAFAKRQRTWFRAEPAIAWLDAAADPDRAARRVAERLLGL
jgi:tRNA dimethylallyltransferase